jgi:ATP-binding cassette subfamily B (MDR/TAP) protein 1
LNKEEWLLVAVGLACSIIAGVEEPASAILFGESIEAISTNLDHPHTVQSRGGFFAIFFFVLAVTMLLVFGAQGIIFAYCSEKMTNRARSLALNQLLRMDVAFFDKKRNSAGALASFLQSSARDLEGVSGNALSVILICFSTLFCSIITAFAYGWKLSLVCLALMPFSLGSGYLGTWLAGEFEKNTEVFNNQAAEFVNETLIGIRTVAAMTREGEAAQHYRQMLNATTTRALKMNLVTSFLHALANSVYYGSMTLSFWYGTRLFLKHEYTLSQFIVIQSSMLMSAYSAGLAFSYVWC